MTRIILPYPVSINRLYRAVRGRSILSAEYRLWKAMAGALLLSQRPQKHDGAVNITVDLCPPDKRRRDIDNVGSKAVLDLLKTHSIIQDDDSRYVRSITARWVEAGEPCVVTVEPAQ